MTEIVKVPNPILTQKAKTVDFFDKRLHILIKNMKDALLGATNPRGVGLAAPQIGEPWRVFITKPTSKSPVRVYINPEIIQSSKSEASIQKEHKLEGCLSVPSVWGNVKRSVKLKLTFSDEKGINLTQQFSGFEAIIIQHEVDHLNGVLFTQRVLEQKGKLYQPKSGKDGKEYLEEIKI